MKTPVKSIFLVENSLLRFPQNRFKIRCSKLISSHHIWLKNRVATLFLLCMLYVPLKFFIQFSLSFCEMPMGDQVNLRLFMIQMLDCLNSLPISNSSIDFQNQQCCKYYIFEVFTYKEPLESFEFKCIYLLIKFIWFSIW